MPSVRLMVLAVLVVACGGSERIARSTDADGALLPDTQTVDGVLEMRHAADAFERAPQWRIDTVPMVVFDGGAAVDLSSSSRMHLLSDGRGVVQIFGGDHGGHLRVFAADGTPGRILARGGAGPGEMAGSAFLVIVPGDTIYLVDGTNGYVNRYTADSGFLGGTRGERVPKSCIGPISRLTDGRYVGVDGCGQARRLPDGSLSPMVALYMVAGDFTTQDSIAAVPGTRMALVDIAINRQTQRVMSELALGQRTTVTAVDSTIVVGSGDGGHVLDLRDARGVPAGRIIVERPVVLMTDEIKRAVTEATVAQMVANGDPNFTAERVREMAEQRPFADTVGAYVTVSSTEHGTIWVHDMPLLWDSTWSATAFRRDGAILGRLTGRNAGGLAVWFGEDRVMIREEDDDGVVRYGVYRIVKQ